MSSLITLDSIIGSIVTPIGCKAVVEILKNGEKKIYIIPEDIDVASINIGASPETSSIATDTMDLVTKYIDTCCIGVGTETHKISREKQEVHELEVLKPEVLQVKHIDSHISDSWADMMDEEEEQNKLNEKQKSKDTSTKIPWVDIVKVNTARSETATNASTETQSIIAQADSKSCGGSDLLQCVCETQDKRGNTLHGWDCPSKCVACFDNSNHEFVNHTGGKCTIYCGQCGKHGHSISQCHFSTVCTECKYGTKYGNMLHDKECKFSCKKTECVKRAKYAIHAISDCRNHK